MNTEWSRPWFCAVPVLPHASNGSRDKALHVPFIADERMPATT